MFPRNCRLLSLNPSVGESFGAEGLAEISG
jgi:hypothetical protein